MRLGILADIHEHVEHLQACLTRFEQEGVDRVILLGDIAETGARLPETVAMLPAVEPDGVFGNHDLGFCRGGDAQLLARYSDAVRVFFDCLRPKLEVGDCLFTHGAPWWDPLDPVEYYLGDDPYGVDSIARAFEEFSQQVIFMGHFHRWKLAIDGHLIEWDATCPLECVPTHRYLITIHAVMYGWCAVYDTEARMLYPHRISYT